MYKNLFSVLRKATIIYENKIKSRYIWPVINRKQKKIMQIHGSTRVQDPVDATRSHHLDVSCPVNVLLSGCGDLEIIWMGAEIKITRLNTKKIVMTPY